ncbi:hypothetical protein M407DRAFT_26610 [Tulasnella calospora MUT 4182]|uniref:Protein kinase domain-containing protein n=1 Tax=Tulasnella calospora MUT 4182 TaxID=1051891 RepID=A0A0C3QFG3_9AGAM|nr:hypothetical protein M407DRAFT_26610 [Tulasnella calospora MUT 4182]
MKLAKRTDQTLHGEPYYLFRIHHTAVEFTLANSHKSGSKADVAQATYRRGNGDDEQVVAVKKLRSIHTKKALNEFVHKVQLMAGLSHENIIRSIGFVEDLGKETAWIVLPWEPNGNVGEFLATGHWEIPERIALDTFKGVRYLHTRRPPICHGDLKSLNILAPLPVVQSLPTLDKLAQGVPTAVQTYLPNVGTTGNQLTLTGPAWSLLWAAPEVMYGKRPGLSSDVWAAGWVCWEVMTDKVPFPELNSAGVITLTFDDGLLFDPKARPNIARCFEELQWTPSTPPSGGNSPGSKATSIELLLRNGDISYNQHNYKNAGSLFQQALALAESAGNRKPLQMRYGG